MTETQDLNETQTAGAASDCTELLGVSTPGPWQLYADTPSTEPNWHIVTNDSRMRIIANVHIEPGNAVDLANARLIQAAPELLASLRELLAAMEDYQMDVDDTPPFTHRQMMARAYAALARTMKPEKETDGPRVPSE